ncbi:MAG: IS66 family insertion sequence element accessory protein TnpB [Bacteroidetes bacterium]|nr:IS66 family insertion sequence element accessory protein TnpB [Bacteroidota bacterium]
MRKSINGLSILVSEQLELNPFSGHLFVFCNRKRNMVKILYWDQNGFCIWHKKLEKNTFRWPDSKEHITAIGKRKLAWLLDEINIHQKYTHKPLKYSMNY